MSSSRASRRQAARHLDDLARYYSGRPSRRAENIGCIVGLLKLALLVTVIVVAVHFIVKAW